MALTKNITLSSGINLPNAYIRIVNIDIINGVNNTIKVDIFKDKTARDDNKLPAVQLSHICTDMFFDFFGFDVLNQQDVNVISQSYEFLKTINFYKDAIDVLDVKE